MRRTEALYAAVGKFVLQWSDLELGLDLLVLITRKLPPTEQSVPHQLRDKVDFLRKRLRNVSIRADYRDELDLLLRHILDLAGFRHDLIHSAIIQHHPHRSGMIVTMARLLQPSKHKRRSPTHTTAATIKKMTRLVEVTADELLDFAQKLNAGEGEVECRDGQA